MRVDDLWNHAEKGCGPMVALDCGHFGVFAIVYRFLYEIVAVQFMFLKGGIFIYFTTIMISCGWENSKCSN